MVAGPYDALLLLSFGGPEGPDEVQPFLANVTRGRAVPPARLAEVAEHYHRFGGVSPLNEQCRALVDALREDFAAHGLNLPVYWGNRNWHPFVIDTVGTMAADGIRRALVLTTSAYASYSGCRQYQEDLRAACAAVGSSAPRFDRIRHYFNHPGFLAPMVDSVAQAFAALPPPQREPAVLLCSTHSLPQSMADRSGSRGGAYVAQHRQVAELLAAGVSARLGWEPRWSLVFQSRSGPPTVPWLEPDILDELATVHAAGVPAVVVAPIGFTSDHMEVRFDLDVEAADRARELGLGFARAATVGAAPAFVAAVRDLVLERVTGRPRADRLAMGAWGPDHDDCPAHCCPARAPSPRPCGTVPGESERSGGR